MLSKDTKPLNLTAEKSCIIFVLLVHVVCNEVGLVCYLHIKTRYFKNFTLKIVCSMF